MGIVVYLWEYCGILCGVVDIVIMIGICYVIDFVVCMLFVFGLMVLMEDFGYVLVW